MCHQQPNTPQAEAHSYAQGCRLHNTSASWNGSQYYWLTQDTGSSQRSSRKAPVPSLLASVFICLSFKPIAQQAASDFSQIFILLDRRDTKSITHTHTKQSLRTLKGTHSHSVTHVVREQARHFTAMPYAGHAGYPHTCKSSPETSSVRTWRGMWKTT